MFARAAITKDRRLGGFNNRNSIVSQFWRLDVHDQGVSRVDTFKDNKRGICVSPLLGMWMGVFSLGLFKSSSLHESHYPNFPFP